MMQRRRGSVVLFLVLVIGLLLAACGGGDDTTEPADETSAAAPVEADAGTLATTLADFSIATASSTIPTGPVVFDVTNEGPSVHELVVLKTDKDAGELPVGDDNSVDEAGMDLVDEVEDVESGATASLEVELEPGHYALICNIPGHYELGMWANLEVE